MIFAPHVLREYAFLADGQRGALVGPRGDVSWLCVPGWDDDAVFATLLGGRGVYAVAPADRFVWGGYYETGTLIWRSRWVAGSAVIECREALAFPGQAHRAVLLRRIVAVNETAEVDIVLRPAAAFGARPMTAPHRDGDGVWHARTGPIRVRWTGAAAMTVTDDGYWSGRLSVPAGESHDLVLELSDTRLPERPPEAEFLWAETESAWAKQVPELGGCVAARDAGQAFAVLRGMTADSGGMVAAATTSLPERADQNENYDYRYVWIRDQCLAGQAVAAVGPHPLLDAAVDFTAERLLADGPDVLPAYTVAGRQVPAVRELELPGYPGARPVVGNRARRQFQLDTFGEALLLFAAAGRHDRLSAEHRRAVEVAVAAIADRYRRPDAGIWELDDQLWTHSRLTCAAGLRAAASCPSTGVDTAACSALADTLLAAAARTGLHPEGRWQRGPRHPGVDAALLFPMIRGALPVDDPRYANTFRAVEDELCSDFYVYRYRHDERPLEVCEGAFLLCGFTTAIAAAQLGRPVTAMRFFERNRAACGTPGLFAEEFDVTQRQLRGNLPQAFVHAALLEAAVCLSGLRERGDG
ncbi:glycoside hydrolase family 15 protein [Nocardia terpenica]|uniref:Glycoside hydrolase n=1 Tax=Nocardia terpenica TaxID=455432 RepID=A0A164NEW0_9NOCA|nr:glycoside hydrolase family 15 protein [Nocardia terpenica]KZM74286.1 glycoside hydrolase [Nocardia terpenica]NQE93146.1 glycoside hydrolase family 15 protein [Nocardia terpenica]